MTSRRGADGEKTRLIVALDTPSAIQAVRTAEDLLPEVDFFKIGLGLFCAAGPAIITELKALGAMVFLDLKLHDIPEQVRLAAEIVGGYGVDVLSVHSLGGREMLRAAHEGMATGSRAAGKPEALVVGVTILTSLGAQDLEDMGVRSQVESEVGILAALVRDAGLSGVVASARELPVIRSEFGRELTVITPGIRPVWAGRAADQKRVVTPKQAVSEGADFIVVGRPITAAPEPREAALRLLAELS